MIRNRAFYEERLAEELRNDYLLRREDAVFQVREFGGEVKFCDEPDWAERANTLLDAEMARMALESVRERLSKK